MADSICSITNGIGRCIHAARYIVPCAIPKPAAVVMCLGRHEEGHVIREPLIAVGWIVPLSHGGISEVSEANGCIAPGIEAAVVGEVGRCTG